VNPNAVQFGLAALIETVVDVVLASPPSPAAAVWNLPMPLVWLLLGAGLGAAFAAITVKAKTRATREPRGVPASIRFAPRPDPEMRVELSADRIDGLRDVLRGPARRALEEHVLDEVRDAAALGGFMARAARQPDADADRADRRHPLSEKTKTVTENVSDDRRIRQGVGLASRNALTGATGPEIRRKAFRESNLPTRGHSSMAG